MSVLRGTASGDKDEAQGRRQGVSAISGDEARELLEPGHRVWWQCRSGGEGASFTVGDPYTRDLPGPRGPVNHGMVPTATGQGQRVSFNVIP